jgi:hypothetical protein
MGIFNRNKINDGVRGTAHVVSNTIPDPGLSYERAFMRLVVQIPGRPAYQVKHDEVARRDRWPWPGTVLPVLVDGARPERLKVLWDEVPTSGQRLQAEAQAMVDSLNNPAQQPPRNFVQGPGVGVVHLSDPAAMAEFGPMIKRAEQMIGRDLDGDGKIGPGPQDGPSAEGDPLERLERLSALYAAGQLTDKEFEKAKRRILGF